MDEATLRLAARRLIMESRALEAVQTLTDAGVSARVVKGLTLAAQLYDEGESRPYGDIDLLVDPRHWDRAVRALGEIGYAVAPAGGLHSHPIHSIALRRTGPGGSVSEIDLHHRFHGVRVGSRAFWRIAGAHPVTVDVGDSSVLTTPVPVTGYHLLVSVLPEHGGGGRHVEEWRRFGVRYPAEVPAVAAIATSLRATNAFERATAVVEGVPAGAGPPPLPLRIRSIAVSAWIAHMRRAPSMRARATLIREVAQDWWTRRRRA